MNFSSLEQQLGIKLPESYKLTYEENPFRDYESGDELSLIRSLEWLEKENVSLRESGYYGYEWLDGYFAFGKDGTGGIYFLDTRNDTSPIYFLHWEQNHAPHELQNLVYAVDFTEYKKKIIQLNIDAC